MAQTVLTPEEQKMVDDFASKIDVENLTQVMQYGAGTQKKMADFSDEALKNVRAQDLGEVGELLSGVVGELKGFDAEEEKGFLGFFKKQANKVENFKNRYDKAEVNVEKIADALEKHQVRLLKDSAMMDKMYEQNLLYFKELSMYIQAGKQRLAQTRNGKLHDLEEKAKMTGLPEDAQAAKDLDRLHWSIRFHSGKARWYWHLALHIQQRRRRHRARYRILQMNSFEKMQRNCIWHR